MAIAHAWNAIYTHLLGRTEATKAVLILVDAVLPAAVQIAQYGIRGAALSSCQVETLSAVTGRVPNRTHLKVCFLEGSSSDV
jgi:hypothetical protein